MQFIKYFLILQIWISILFSVEIHEKKLKFFTLDWHSSVTKDLIDIFHDLGHEVTYWSIGPYTQRIFKHDNVRDDFNHPVMFDVWKNPHLGLQNFNEEACYEFYEIYKDFLNQFDAFIVSPHSNLAFIFEKLNKPVIFVNAARYSFPFEVNSPTFEKLNQLLIERHNKGDFFFVANNKGDRYYLNYYTSIDSKLIPSLCSYTNSKYIGKNSSFLLHKPTSPDIISKLKKFMNKGTISYLESFQDWDTLYTYKGIIHFPYQISVMSLFEQYYANVPLFFPSQKFLLKLREESPFILSFVSTSPCPGILNSPDNLSNPKILKLWLRMADFYDKKNMPYIQYFSSLNELDYLLSTVNTQVISKKMEKHNIKRKKMIYAKWKNLLEEVANQVSKSKPETALTHSKETGN